MGIHECLKKLDITASELAIRCRLKRSTLGSIMVGGGGTWETGQALIEGSNYMITLPGLIKERRAARRLAEKGRNR